MRTEDGPEGSGDPHPVGGLVAAQAAVGVERGGPDSLASGQRGQQRLGERLRRAGLDERGGQDGGEHRSGGDDPAEFLEDDDELGHAEPGAAVGVVEVDAEPAVGGQVIPERWAGLGGRVEQGPRYRRGAVALAPAPQGVVEREMVFGDADRHPVILRTA